MDFDQARQLVVTEGVGEDGIVVAIRMGDIPSGSRMAPLLTGLEVIYQHLHGHHEIDRELANALFGLTFHVQGEIDGMISSGTEIPDTFIEDEMVRMFLLVESILEDEWMLE